VLQNTLKEVSPPSGDTGRQDASCSRIYQAAAQYVESEMKERAQTGQAVNRSAVAKYPVMATV
jgi:hypothetical protein